MNPLQHRSLQLYLYFRERPMTVAALLWANRRVYLIMGLFFGGLGSFVYSQFGSEGAVLVAVAFVTVVLRDIGYWRRSVKIWPVLKQVLDWNKVEQLASPNSTESV